MIRETERALQPTDDEREHFARLQYLIDTGSAWVLEGSVGRACMTAIRAGGCILPRVRHRDAYGNTVPARTDLVPGMQGTEGYARRMRPDLWPKQVKRDARGRFLTSDKKLVDDLAKVILEERARRRL